MTLDRGVFTHLGPRTGHSNGATPGASPTCPAVREIDVYGRVVVESRDVARLRLRVCRRLVLASAVSVAAVLAGAVTAATRPVITGWGSKPVDAKGNYTLCVSVKGDPRPRLAGWMSGVGISGPGTT